MQSRNPFDEKTPLIHSASNADDDNEDNSILNQSKSNLVVDLPGFSTNGPPSSFPLENRSTLSLASSHPRKLWKLWKWLIIMAILLLILGSQAVLLYYCRRISQEQQQFKRRFNQWFPPN